MAVTSFALFTVYVVVLLRLSDRNTDVIDSVDGIGLGAEVERRRRGNV
jgi:hypothetical protein